MRTYDVLAGPFSIVVAAAAAVGCGSTPSSELESADRVGSTVEALKRIGVDSDPPAHDDDPPPPPKPCPSLRFDLYRNSGQVCAMPPAAPGGTWTMEPLFPNAPAAVRNRLCAYTWTPSGQTPHCAAPPLGSIARTPSENLGARGHCPLNQAGCGTTTVNMGGRTLPTATLSTMAAGRRMLALQADPIGGPPSPPTPAFPEAASAARAQPSSSSGAATPLVSPGIIPASGVGCCDACAEVTNDSTFVVLPENIDYSSVYFDVGYETPSGIAVETVTLDSPATNVIQVNLNPNRTYTQGMIWAIHMTR